MISESWNKSNAGNAAAKAIYGITLEDAVILTAAEGRGK